MRDGLGRGVGCHRGGPDGEIAVQRYRNALESEKLRRLCFTQGLTPGLPKRVPAYTHMHLDAINHLRENRIDEARALLEQAADARPPVACRVNGELFDDIRDADDLIGPKFTVGSLGSGQSDHRRPSIVDSSEPATVN